MSRSMKNKTAPASAIPGLPVVRRGLLPGLPVEQAWSAPEASSVRSGRLQCMKILSETLMEGACEARGTRAHAEFLERRNDSVGLVPI